MSNEQNGADHTSFLVQSANKQQISISMINFACTMLEPNVLFNATKWHLISQS